ncbi:uncharacterized protein [Setaria viridis]|uniref:uncharacterized protein n=1 Tax=Setaria viridis TaxID=4556 RepID=UPI003B3A1C42
MASSSNSLAMLGPAIFEKLSRDNFLLWKAQIPSAIKGARFMGILDGSSKAPAKTMSVEKADKRKEEVLKPAYEAWQVQDQQLLNYIVNSLTKDVLASVATVTTSAEAWAALETMYSSQSRAKSTNLWLQLSTLKKGNIGKPIGDAELISVILLGLNYEYNPIVTSVMGRVDPIPLNKLYAQLVTYETLLELLHENYNNDGFSSSANSAS